MARIAIAAGGYSGREPIDEWVDHAVDVSMDDLLAEQADEERRGVAPERSVDALFYAQFAAATGMDFVDARSEQVEEAILILRSERKMKIWEPTQTARRLRNHPRFQGSPYVEGLLEVLY